MVECLATRKLKKTISVSVNVDEEVETNSLSWTREGVGIEKMTIF